MTDKTQTLTIDQDICGWVLENQFEYYKLEVKEQCKMLVIVATPINQQSNVDIYISSYSRNVNQSNYTWKSANVGINKVQLHPSDQKYNPGEYYIGVYGYKTGLNEFVLHAYYTEVDEIIQLKSEYTSLIEKQKYFQFQVQNPGQSRLEIKIGSRGKLAMLISTTSYYPSYEEYQYSSGLYPQVQDHSLEIDPYHNHMPKEFSLKWQECEMPDQQNEFKVKQVRFCNDTDDWKYIQGNCFIAVINLLNEVSDFTINAQELILTTLLDGDTRNKLDLFNQTFCNSEGSQISKRERKRLKISHLSDYAFGEIDCIYMMKVLELCHMQPGQVLWDLGCGIGKFLLAAGLQCPFLKCIKGIEFIPGLAQQAQQYLSNIQLPQIQIIQGDIIEVDWRDADWVFISNTCFTQQLMSKIFEKAMLLQKGTKIIALKPLPQNDAFEVQEKFKSRMTWGKSNIYILEKLI